METIYIKEKNNNTIIYLDKQQYYSYQYLNDSVKSIDYQNLKIFKLFTMSKNYTKLKKYRKYDVYLDNETGLKHYFSNNNENFYLLFKNNGRYAINYFGNNHELSSTKIFKLKNKLIVCTFLGLLLAISNINKPETKIINYINVLVNNYELSDIEKMINLSPHLNKEEKKYLYNEPFITDVLKIINTSFYEKNKWSYCFDSINIVGYNDAEHESNAGYYNIDNPSTLYIKNYEELDDKNKDTVAHEFAHLCQDIGEYNLLTEASAEIIVQEYFSTNHQFCYKKQVKLTKKLMEIIGPYPIWYYNFTGDFSKIEELVLPYLTQEEYQTFLNDLSFNPNDTMTNETKYQELNTLLNNLYYYIYQKDIKDDEIISLIDNDNPNLVRYYFNERMINEENSYYLNYDLGTHQTISYQEAIDNGIISAYTISYIEISKEAALKIIEDDTYYLRRDIDYRSHNISINHSKHEVKKTTISGLIDGVRYDDANVDDLVKDGLIDVTYYIIDKKELTGSDYENHNYQDDEIYFVNTKYTTINETNIDVLVPQKIYLPTINNRYQNSKQYTKKKKITSQ